MPPPYVDELIAKAYPALITPARAGGRKTGPKRASE
jgi:hypothetical protein